jgi:TetR/AcrR family transcriptional regulator, cholesterol catabolism regulator
MAVELDVESLTPNQAARRRRVIDAAMKLAADGGYDAVQMRDVAAEAGVALGTIYRYFASKDHLLAACQVEWARDIERQLQRRPARGDTAADRVVDVLRRATRSTERSPKLTAALVTAISSSDPAVSGCQREMTAIMAGVLTSPMSDLDARFRDGIIRALSHVWFSSLLSWVNGWTPVGAVGAELESAARLLLRED